MATAFIRSTTGRSYRRAGLEFTPQWTEVDIAALDADRRALIEADPHLRIRRDRPASLPLSATGPSKPNAPSAKADEESKPKADKGGK